MFALCEMHLLYVYLGYIDVQLHRVSRIYRTKHKIFFYQTRMKIYVMHFIPLVS